MLTIFKNLKHCGTRGRDDEKRRKSECGRECAERPRARNGEFFITSEGSYIKQTAAKLLHRRCKQGNEKNVFYNELSELREKNTNKKGECFLSSTTRVKPKGALYPSIRAGKNLRSMFAQQRKEL